MPRAVRLDDIPRPRAVDRAGKLQHLRLRPLRRVQPTAAQVVQFLRRRGNRRRLLGRRHRERGRSRNKCSACSESRFPLPGVACPGPCPDLVDTTNARRRRSNRQSRRTRSTAWSGKIGDADQENRRCLETVVVARKRPRCLRADSHRWPGFDVYPPPLSVSLPLVLLAVPASHAGRHEQMVAHNAPPLCEHVHAEVDDPHVARAAGNVHAR